MKYGTSLIIASVITIITIFSGFPTSWKKIIIVTSSLFILSVGLILRAKAKKKAELLKKRSERVQELAAEEINELVDKITEDVNHQVEEEIDRI